VHARQRLSAKLTEQQPWGSTLSTVREQGHVRAVVRDDTHQLFRNKLRPELICAVADHRPLPSFLSPEQWRREGSLGPSDVAPPGFREQAAVAGIQLNGFYLFQRLRTQHEVGQILNNTRNRTG
jgi:hypothetical protein